MEWVEVEAPTLDQAITTALAELKLASRDEAVVEVLREAKSGFLGIGAQNAIVKVMPKPKEKSSRRRRGKSKGSSDDAGSSKSKTDRGTGSGGASTPRGSSSGSDDRRSSGPGSKESSGGSSSGSASSGSRGGRGGKSRDGGSESSGKSDGGSGGGRSGGRNDGSRNERGSSERSGRGKDQSKSEKDTRPEEASIEEQATVASDFLKGLLGAFGLEGDVTTRIEDDTLYIDVTGDQTEALVGPKGAVMQAVHEVTRTVVQRKTFGAPRMRLDIAGYGERRREALTIYARKLADRVKADDAEVMLEPMNAADRKVVHDAVTDVEGVRSFSEGEDPHRAVVLAPDD